MWLPSGGSLIIEHTEALTVIDVNTGKNVGTSNLEETVFRNNLEAAEEIARQLRLRDIGGIIVIDFIDMEIKDNRDEVVKAFRDALARDKTRTQVFDISELGLVEMTRKRIGEGLLESFSPTCPHCEGRGWSSTRACSTLSLGHAGAGPRLVSSAGPDPLGVAAAMYAVIKTGGKQYRVDEGQRLDVERLGRRRDEVDAHPGPRSSTATPCSPRPPSSQAPRSPPRWSARPRARRSTASPTRPSRNQRKRWGHRQHYADHRDHRASRRAEQTMSKTKGGGSTRNGRDSNAQRLGVKVFDGTAVTAGTIIVRQRGTTLPPRRERRPRRRRHAVRHSPTAP